MIIYKDIISGDEVLSDTYNIVEKDGLLLECDCKKYMKKKNEDFALEGANPSAEEGGDDAGGDDEAVMVHDIEDQFRLVWLKVEDGAKPSKDAFKSHLKGIYSLSFSFPWMLMNSLHEKGPAEARGQGCPRG